MIFLLICCTIDTIFVFIYTCSYICTNTWELNILALVCKRYLTLTWVLMIHTYTYTYDIIVLFSEYSQDTLTLYLEFLEYNCFYNISTMLKQILMILRYFRSIFQHLNEPLAIKIFIWIVNNIYFVTFNHTLLLRAVCCYWASFLSLSYII